jgi:hypothetical protein
LYLVDEESTLAEQTPPGGGVFTAGLPEADPAGVIIRPHHGNFPEASARPGQPNQNLGAERKSPGFLR